jgi:hypothetical protein
MGGSNGDSKSLDSVQYEVEMDAQRSHSNTSAFLSADALHDTNTSPDAPSPLVVLTKNQSRRRPIPRKGHTKSRRGCFSCKRRKIKCSESLPACNHCIKAGLRCEYPKSPDFVNHYGSKATREPSHGIEDEGSSGSQNETLVSEWSGLDVVPYPKPIVQLSNIPMSGMFSMSDMKYFHHFIMTAYPHLPIGADKVWINVIPAAAWHYDYLIHSMLALAASHLSALLSDDAQQEAVLHRITAMRSLNAALSIPAKSRMEKDARMAAALALTFQSAHLPNAFGEFLTMVRGCFLIGSEEGFEDPSSAFYAFRAGSHLEVMQERLTTATMSPCNKQVIDAGVASIEALQPLCVSEIEKWLCGALLQILQWAYDYPQKGMLCLWLICQSNSAEGTHCIGRLH